MTLRLVSLGDSTSCGEGVGIRLALGETWPARLAAVVPGAELVPLAAPGARVRDVLQTQALRAVQQEPTVVTLLIGLNDVWRGGFTERRFAQDLRAVLHLLRPTDAVVLLGRLHDPSLLLPLPPALRRTVRVRAAAVNGAVDRAAAAAPGQVHVLDLAAVPGLRERGAWEVDRLHPNAAGHALIAAAAARALRGAGVDAGVPATPALPAAPGRWVETRWALRSGLPWLATHVPQVVLPAVRATAR